MNDLAPIPQAKLTAASTADLRTELARGLTLTADTLSRLGLIWQELEHRGEDLSDLRHGLARTLPLIASGRLAAEAVVAFANRPAILRAIEGVSLERQRAYAAGEEVKVIDPAEPKAVQSMTLSALPAAAIRLVFDSGEVRSPEAQRLALRPRRSRHADRAEYRYRPRYDATAGTVTVGRMTIALADLLAELSAAAGPDNVLMDATPSEYVHVKVRLVPAEAKRLAETAQHAELPDWELIRKAMRAFGLI